MSVKNIFLFYCFQPDHSSLATDQYLFFMEERGGFDPPVELPLQLISSQPPSTSSAISPKPQWSAVSGQGSVKVLSYLLLPNQPLITDYWPLFFLWRREGDSNPRYPLRYTRFPGVLLKPLGHLSINKRKT